MGKINEIIIHHENIFCCGPKQKHLRSCNCNYLVFGNRLIDYHQFV